MPVTPVPSSGVTSSAPGSTTTTAVETSTANTPGDSTQTDTTDNTTEDTATTEDTSTGGESTGSPGAGPVPSPGCGKGGRPNGGKLQDDNRWLLFPESYNGNDPMPVLWGFHGCGSYNRGDASRTEYSDFIRNTPFASEYVTAVPLSADKQSSCWNYDSDIPRVKALYDELVNNHCVDLSRMYATGHSSGAYFAVALLANNHSTDAEYFDFKGMAPVSASPAGSLTTPMPMLYIESLQDSERNNNNAQQVLGEIRGANSCSGDSNAPFAMQGCNSGGVQVDPGCVTYEGCAQPTIWCNHNDPEYQNTYHGIPCFAAQAMYDFFNSLEQD